MVGGPAMVSTGSISEGWTRPAPSATAGPEPGTGEAKGPASAAGGSARLAASGVPIEAGVAAICVGGVVIAATGCAGCPDATLPEFARAASGPNAAGPPGVVANFGGGWPGAGCLTAEGALAAVTGAWPAHCELSGSLIAVLTTAELPIPRLIVSDSGGTDVAATGAGAGGSCFERAERVWAQPVAAKLKRVNTNTRFMIGLVSILGEGQPRLSAFERQQLPRPTAVPASPSEKSIPEGAAFEKK